MPTSSKKSKPAPRKRKQAVSKKETAVPSFESLDGISVESPSAQQISRLQQDLATHKDERLEERFMWIFVVMVLLDIAVSTVVPAAMWVFLGPLQLIFLIVAADKCGMDTAKVALSHLYARLIPDNKDDQSS